MKFEDFTKEVYDWWNKYLTMIYKAQKQNMLDIPEGDLVLYPNILLVTRNESYYIMELLGAVSDFKGLKIKEHKEKDIYRYFSQFEKLNNYDGIRFEGSNCGVKSVCISRNVDFDKIAHRFPQLNLYDSNRTKLVFTSDNDDDEGSYFHFGENFISCSIEDCLLVNQKNNVFRCKNILYLAVFKSTAKVHYVSKMFDFDKEQKTSMEVKGIHTVSENSSNVLLAGQLQSIYLFPGLLETTIGEFLNQHPDIIKKAFRTDHYIYEPYLKWIKYSIGNSDTAINPDLMIRRADGFYDIYDLKTALLSKDRLAKGPHRRRRFIDQVQEGVAQLAHYREYFTFEENTTYAKEKYDIMINNPKCILVIGNYDNSIAEEIIQASRMYNGIDILDYDTLCQMFLG